MCRYRAVMVKVGDLLHTDLWTAHRQSNPLEVVVSGGRGIEETTRLAQTDRGRPMIEHKPLSRPDAGLARIYENEPRLHVVLDRAGDR